MKIEVSPYCDDHATPLTRDLLFKAMKRDDRTLRIATHNGKFHADELLAIAMIKYAVRKASGWKASSGEPEPVKFEIIRTRDPEEIAAADIAVDVGNGPFDHHTSMDRYRNGILMSACGKVLAAVEGDEMLVSLMNTWTLYAVQSTDNGEKSCKFTNNFFNWVGLMNETYTEMKGSEYTNSKPFYVALDMVETLYARMYTAAQEHILAQEYLKHCTRHFRQQILELPSSSVPWRYYVAFQMPTIKAILCPDSSDGTWTVRWVPKYMGAPDTKLLWPVEWRSEKDACEGNTTLAAKKFEFGCNFCHKSLVMANFDSRDHALQAAWFMLHRERFV